MWLGNGDAIVPDTGRLVVARVRSLPFPAHGSRVSSPLSRVIASSSSSPGSSGPPSLPNDSRVPSRGRPGLTRGGRATPAGGDHRRPVPEPLRRFATPGAEAGSQRPSPLSPPTRASGYLDFLDPFLAFLAGFLVPLAAGDFLSAGIPSPPFLAVASIRSHSSCRGCRSGSRCRSGSCSAPWPY